MKDRREFLKFLCSSIGLVAIGGCFAGCAGEGWYGYPERFEGVGEEEEEEEFW